jgi:hypothetical protein
MNKIQKLLLEERGIARRCFQATSKEARVIKKFFKVLMILFLSVSLASTLSAQKLGGSLKGKISDTQGFPLPGAFVYVASSALLGIQNYITDDTGLYGFWELPPGRYKLSVEMPGFKTINIDNIIIQVNMTVTINVTLEASTIEEEITIERPSPTLDVKSTKASFVLDKDILNHIPLARALTDIINTAPSAVSSDAPPGELISLQGAGVRSNAYALDGAPINDSVTMAPLFNINFDTIEEVELETGAHPAKMGITDGGYINVLTKSGGNNMTAGILFYHTAESMAKSLWTNEELNEFQAPALLGDKNLWDMSLTFGGKILEDRAWFFSNVRYNYLSRKTPFVHWSDPQGIIHEAYDWSNKEVAGFFKLSAQINPRFRFRGTFNFLDLYQPVAADKFSWNLPQESTRELDHEKNLEAGGILNYNLSQNTFFDFAVSYVNRSSPYFLTKQEAANPQYCDAGTGYFWGSGGLNEKSRRNIFLASVNATRFQDRFLGASHELKAGGEYEQVSAEMSTWKEDNLFMTYWNGSPYFYGYAPSPKTGNLVGTGLISFYIASKTEGQMVVKEELRRFGVSIQDSATFAGRATFLLGLRFDRSDVRLPTFAKGESGNPVSVKIGEDLVKPLAETNPYKSNYILQWNNMMTWTSWSPRAGLSIDVFKDGKTALKANFSRYPELLSLQYTFPLSPFFPTRYHQFTWYDENLDGKVDTNDTYALYPEDYRLYTGSYYKKRIDSNLAPPYTNEYTVSIQQEIFKDASVSLSYISRTKKNIIENVLYAPDQNQDWYLYDQSTQGWWIPFSTTVPGIDNYPDTPVTAYFWSNSAPSLFDHIKNVPELERKYRAFEFVFKKRMSHNWQLLGSAVFSEATGNIGLDYEATSGFSAAADSPNYFVNLPGNSRLELDRPVLVRVMGTYKFPLGFFLSFYFTHSSGAPWARSVTICPPASWLQEKNAYSAAAQVYLEKPGTRRYQPLENLDLRIEKEMPLKGLGLMRAYLDILNVLGKKYSILNQNDGGFWFPAAENTNQGVRTLDPSYKKFATLQGLRIFKFSLSLEF